MTSRLIMFALPALLMAGQLSTAAENDANWPRWRGPENNGSIATGDYPAEFDSTRVLWKQKLPGKGCSTPVVHNGVIYLTAPAEGRDALLAFDLAGKKLWMTEFGKEKPGKHRNGSGSNPSPVTDGKGVFVSYKSGALAAVNLDGTIRWQTNLVERYGPDTLFWDHGSSPVLTSQYVVATRMHKGESWLAAFDKNSGELKWKTPRNYKTPTEGDHGYATPVVIEYNGAEALLVWGGQHLTIHRVEDGKVIWTCGDFNPEKNRLWPSIATPVISGGVAVVPFGRNDRGIPRLHGIRLQGEGDVTRKSRIWKRDDIGTFVPSPVAYNGKVYLVGDQGLVTCLDPETGKTVWSEKLPKSRHKFYASPLIAGGKLYAAREDGTVFVAGIEDGFKLLSQNDMGESIIASPVPAGNRLLLRGVETLFCVQ